MGKILIIAEKPDAGRNIARILDVNGSQNGYIENDHYIISWAVGHLVKLKDPEDNNEKYKKWQVEDLPLPYDNGLKVIPACANQFKIVKSLIKRSDIDYLINAGDAGREGLLIQSWIYRMCGNHHPVKILWASSLTDEAILSAMNKLHNEDEIEFVNLLREAETRAIADQIYGYNYTRALTCLYSSPGTVLSYGRCQTPLLNLIYKRDMEIENFKAVPYWTMKTEFLEGFAANEIDDEGNNKKYLKKDDADNAFIRCGKEGIVKVIKKEQNANKAPALLNLAEIQNVMGKKHGLEPDETLAIAQKLYETHKILSYPRTDSRYLSTDLYGEIAEHINSCSFGKFKQYIEKIDFSNFPMDKAYFNNNKVSDHHALIPNINKNTEEIYTKLSDMERNLFDEIVTSLIAIFYPPYKYETTDVLIEVSERTFQTSGKVVKSLGYKEVQNILGNIKEDDEKQTLPDLVEGQILHITKLELNESMTKPPGRYHPGNIVKLMNKYKIGTPATSANIIKTLQKRGFIILDNKKKYKSTQFGREFLERIPDILKNKNLTIEFEKKLSQVNTGEMSQEEFLQDIISQMKYNIDEFKKDAAVHKLVPAKSIGKCPVCGKEILESNKSWHCSGYNDEVQCKFSIWKTICGKKMNEDNVQELITKRKTRLIKGFKSSQGRQFDAYVVLKENNTTGLEFPQRKK